MNKINFAKGSVDKVWKTINLIKLPKNKLTDKTDEPISMKFNWNQSGHITFQIYFFKSFLY